MNRMKVLFIIVLKYYSVKFNYFFLTIAVHSMTWSFANLISDLKKFDLLHLLEGAAKAAHLA